VREGTFVGTRWQSLRLEGFAIKLVGIYAWQYNVFYQAHLQNFGDTGVYKNGEFCGTRGQARRVEALRVWIAPKW
jgi:uncharacterized protein YjdB